MKILVCWFILFFTLDAEAAAGSDEEGFTSIWEGGGMAAAGGGAGGGVEGEGEGVAANRARRAARGSAAPEVVVEEPTQPLNTIFFGITLSN